MPGKLLYTADALSRAPASPVINTEDDSLQEDAELFVTTVVSSLPASRGRLVEYQKAQQEDPTLTTVREYCSKGWPPKDTIGPELNPYWTVQSSLTLGNNLLLYNNRQWRSYSGAQWGIGPTISLCGPTISKSIYHVTQFHSKLFYA